MTAAELASFRALLQAQTPPPFEPDRGLFARMRARLTVLEGGAPTSATPRASAPPPRLEIVPWCEPGAPLADPPPSQPPAFGRREHGAPPPVEIDAAAETLELAEPTPPSEAERSVRLRPMPARPDGLATPDHFDDARSQAPSGHAAATIAGWSRSRPPSAHRRLLGRLEAVLLAERQGLDMRREAEVLPQRRGP